MSRIYQAENGEKPVEIRRGRYDSLSLYEVTEHELDILKQGTPLSVLLTVGISLCTIGISFLIALFTTPITTDSIIFVVFTSIVVGSLIGSLVCICWWYSNRQSVTSVIEKIKSRMPDKEEKRSRQDEGAQQSDDDDLEQTHR